MAKRHGRPSAQYRYEHYDPLGDPSSSDSSGDSSNPRSSDNQEK
jgi:hypothetical protein